MANTRYTLHDFEEEQEEVPSLTKSGMSDSTRSLSSDSHSSSDRDGDGGARPPRRRAADAGATVTRSSRSGSRSRARGVDAPATSECSARSRSLARPSRRAAAAHATVDRSTRSRSSSRARRRAADAAATPDRSVRSRSRARPSRRAADAAAPAPVDRSLRSRSTSRARQRAASRPRPPSSRSRSRPRSSSRRRPAAARRQRFSRSRRPSLDDTTLHHTPHRAMLDFYLGSTCGLRLDADGTCAFVFEDQRFTIEITEATGDVSFHADFGSLQALERQSRPRNFLKVLATWNEGLNLRHGVAEGGEEASGLLRIDSSRAAGPRVAFILYGHVLEMRDAAFFGRMLDDFVDDSLEFSDQIRGIRNKPEASGAERIKAVSLSDAAGASWQKPSSDDESPNCDEFAKATTIREAASEDTKGPQKAEATPLTAADSHKSLFSSSDVYHATSKNRFQKLLGKLSKSGNEDADADADADHAFTVDASEEGRHLKPKIVLSRKPPDEKADDVAAGTVPSARRVRSLFRSGFGSSLQGLHRKRGAQASDGDGDHEKSFNQSIDIFDKPGPAPSRRGGFHLSEPVVARRPGPEPSSSSAKRHPSRRRSVVGPPRRRRPTKLNSVQDEDWGGSMYKGGSQGRSGRNCGAMSQSEPILARAA